MAPPVLEPDADPDVDERQVVVEDVRAKRDDNDEPAGKGKGDEQEPGQAGGTEVAPRASVQPAEVQPRSARGIGFRGSGPMYSDCGRIMRLLAACSST